MLQTGTSRFTLDVLICLSGLYLPFRLDGLAKTITELFPALLPGAFSESAQDRLGGSREIDPMRGVKLARPPE